MASTTSFRLCAATQRYFLLHDGISVLPADEEDKSELSTFTIEPLNICWPNLEKDIMNRKENMHNHTYRWTRNEGKACLQIKYMHTDAHCYRYQALLCRLGMVFYKLCAQCAHNAQNYPIGGRVIPHHHNRT